MQYTTPAYRRAMKDILRERGYIKVFFGLLNNEAQANAKISSFAKYYYSTDDNVFEQQEASSIVDYAILDDDYTRVDGSMYFPPTSGEFSQGAKIDTGLVSASMCSQTSPVVLKIALNTRFPEKIKGLTIEFSDTYPVDFDIISDSGETIEIRGNDTPHFKTEEVIAETSNITLKFMNMSTPHSHVHIHYILFGFGLIYTNNQIQNSTLDNYVSPISEDVPQSDFSFTVGNLDQYFNVDNPSSAINFFETGQTMDVMYGMYIKEEDRVEWVHGTTLLCDEWSADDTSATIKCVDRLRLSDTMYNDGRIENGGTSLYTLAERVFAVEGIEDYYIDPYLKTLKTPIPMPRVTTKEALQLIANAAQSTLSYERDGTISIRSNFIPDRTISCNGEHKYSNVQNIMVDDKKDEYANFDVDYTIADGDMYMMPENGGSSGSRHLGYVSKAQSSTACKFTTNPTITIEQVAARRLYGLDIRFGHTLPSGMVIKAANDGILVDEFEVTEGIVQNMHIEHDFPDFTKLTVEFTGTEKPKSHIVVNYLNFSSIAGFTMTRNDMTSSPTTTRATQIEAVVVSYYTYMPSTEENPSDVVSVDNVDVQAGDKVTYYFDDPSYNFSVEDSSLLDIIESSVHYVKVRFKQTGTKKVVIKGYQYNVIENTVEKALNPEGDIINWQNTLIGTKELAEKVLAWLSDYYSDVVEYTYDHRGFPELDVTDIIQQDNDFVDVMYVEPYEFSTTFNGAFGGSITARRRDL